MGKRFKEKHQLCLAADVVQVFSESLKLSLPVDNLRYSPVITINQNSVYASEHKRVADRLYKNGLISLIHCPCKHKRERGSEKLETEIRHLFDLKLSPGVLSCLHTETRF